MGKFVERAPEGSFDMLAQMDSDRIAPAGMLCAREAVEETLMIKITNVLVATDFGRLPLLLSTTDGSLRARSERDCTCCMSSKIQWCIQGPNWWA
jgi:hypothetical protein